MDKNSAIAIALCLLAIAVLWPSRVTAEGAVAIGIAPGGNHAGLCDWLWRENQNTLDLARQQALDGCRKQQTPLAPATARCQSPPFAINVLPQQLILKAEHQGRAGQLEMPRKPRMIKPSADVETPPGPIAELFARSKIGVVMAMQNRALLKN